MLASTVEIANDHLIFGNEYLVDATDYRFSTAGIPYADQIIAQELDELEQAARQFELIMELIFRAFNEWRVGDYCSSDQFEQFGVTSSLLMTALNEMAGRYYMMGQSDKALDVYDEAYRDQYLQATALAEMAEQTGERLPAQRQLGDAQQPEPDARAGPGDPRRSGLLRLCARICAVAGLRSVAGTDRGPDGRAPACSARRATWRTRPATAQRTFDANASDMATELDNLTVELNDQLFELCGQSEDDYESCDGGLMEQNFEALDAASLRVGLAWLRAQNMAEQIRIEEERAGQVIRVTLGLGQRISAYELAIGKLQAQRTTRHRVNILGGPDSTGRRTLTR